MATIVELSSNMVQVTKEALLTSVNNPASLEVWIKKCTQNVKILNSALKKGDLSVGGKKSLESNIGKIKGFRVQMKSLQLRQGAGNLKEKRSDRIKWDDINSTFRGRVRTGVIINLRHVDPLTFLEDAFYLFNSRIKNALKEHPSMKVNVDFCGEFAKESGDSIIFELKNFITKNQPIYPTTDIKEWWAEHVQDSVLVQLEDFQERDSGWALSAIVNLAVNINRYEPLRGSSYLPLPIEIQIKKACINVRNEDQRCFAWAIVSALYPPRNNPKRPNNYPEPSTVLNLTGLEFPMTMSQIYKFEKQNAISVNVFVLKPKRVGYKVLPTHLTKKEQHQHVNLLLIQDTYDEDVEEVKFHYVWIKNLSRLVSSQVSARTHRSHICDRCLQYFRTSEQLCKHKVDCIKINECKVLMPWREKEKIVKFTNHKNQIPIPFIIYADFESMLQPINQSKGTKSVLYQKHEAYSIGYYLKCHYDDTLSYYKSYRGKDATKWFMKELQQVVEDVEPVFWAPQPMNLTPEEEQSFQASTTCHICKKPLEADQTKVRDHNHMTSEFRGAAHDSCNLNFQENKTIPVVFHNLSGYDAHFLIRDLAREIEGNISLLPINKEKYISFTKHIRGSDIAFRFIDSFRFMAEGLDKLASYLNELKIVRKEHSTLSEEKIRLLTRKGVFPYDYVTSWEKLDELQLPTMNDFENKLNKANISGLDYKKRQVIMKEREAQLTKDYEHARNVWREFDCKTLGEYSDLYLKTDVLLLADVFENFRDTCLATYGLDAAHYVSTPGLTWDALLQYTRVELELLTDIDMLIFVELGIRGGLSQCSHRYAKANNKYMFDYVPSQQSSYLMYYDVNNLYGWAMSQFLPYGGFKWCHDARLDITQVADDSPVGYILEVDLEYPPELHDRHKDLPFCPQKIAPPGGKEQKLLTTLYNKERYVIHYRTLKQALKYGLRITRIHRVLQFNQSAWMKPYIDLNTQMRTQAKNEFQKNFYKLMNNACFGKTMEDVRKRKIVKLVGKWEGRWGAKVKIANPNFHSRLIMDEDLMLIELNKSEVKMCKPVYVGLSVLDISKTKLYEFHYGYMLPKYNNACKVLYTDTDSLIYHVQCNDIYEDIKKDIERFDTSDYHPENPYGIPRVHKKIPGKLKDENCGKLLTEFVGLRAKMYSLRVEGEDATKKAKGVKAYVVKQTLTFDDYVQCLTNGREVLREQNCIRSLVHNVYTLRQTKIALSPFDNKRCLLPQNTDTLPWGHYSLLNMNN